MTLKTPSTGTPTGLRDFFAGLTAKGIEPFVATLKEWTGVRHCGLVNSGTTAWYVILKALSQKSDRDEVLMPAYTAPSLALPVRAAGLKCKFCEMSLDTFNVDTDELAASVSDRTLCVLAVHMYGLPMDMSAARDCADRVGAFLVDDAASALGSKLNGKLVGTLGDVGFFSFNRGKNLATLAGGAWLTDREDLARVIESEAAELPALGLTSRAKVAANFLALSFAVRPLFYSLLYPLVTRRKYSGLHYEFDSFQYTTFQAGAGRSIFRRAEEILGARAANGAFLREALRGLDGVELPTPLPESEAVYNQFPLLLPSRALRDEACRLIVEQGIEATTLYDEPVPATYDFLKDEIDVEAILPIAKRFSETVLLVPTHPLMTRQKLEVAVDAIRRTIAGRAS